MYSSLDNYIKSALRCDTFLIQSYQYLLQTGRTAHQWHTRSQQANYALRCIEGSLMQLSWQQYMVIAFDVACLHSLLQSLLRLLSKSHTEAGADGARD